MLIFVNNIFSNKKISKKIKSFQPDLVYVHNTWFKLSLGFVNIIKKESIPILFKIHNFRYSCTNSFSIKKHLNGKKYCNACGLTSSKNLLFNKYYQASYLKSFFVILHSKKYLKILNQTNTNLFITIFKGKMKSLGILDSNLKIIPIQYLLKKILTTAGLKSCICRRL